MAQLGFQYFSSSFGFQKYISDNFLIIYGSYKFKNGSLIKSFMKKLRQLKEKYRKQIVSKVNFNGNVGHLKKILQLLKNKKIC